MGGGVLRFGLIGAGHWGRNFIDTIDGLVDVGLAWVVDPDPDPAIAPQCPLFENREAAFQSGTVDGIIIASPPSCHDADIRAAVAQGLPVLVEKPFVPSAPAARNLSAYVEERCGYVLVDHTHLFHPGYAKLKEMATALGSPGALRSAGGNWGPFRANTPVLWDWGPHDVALCLDLMGEPPVAVKARCLEKRETPEGWGENLALELEFAGGTRASIEIGNLFRQKRRSLKVDFGDQTLLLDDTAADKLTRAAGTAKFEAVAIPDEPPLSCALQAFAEAVRAKSKDAAPLRFAAQVVEVLEQCERALAEYPYASVNQQSDHGRNQYSKR